MDKLVREADRGVRASSELFLMVEHLIMIVLGIVLSATAILALGSSGMRLWDALSGDSAGKTLLLVVDRLLFVLMVVEILHTVRVSIRSGSLTCEPFLIVGLIASIRRVLVITLESAQYMPGKSSEPGHEETFYAAMLELGVLAGLILVMVASIYLLRRSRAQAAQAEA